ncbi:hypothetical protein [Glaciihabitans sp. UYNi722]|uniref:hypothetical protein n=1 Tax=Glaciihabitans sp. UYNi722 TaxID=3156344 RepID=UPI003398972A
MFASESPSRDEAQRLLTDPEMLARLRDIYRGRHDVADALWWRANPGAASPMGRPDPSDALDPLRRAVFSREGASATMVETDDPLTGERVQITKDALSLRMAERTIRDDDRALDEAILAFHPPTAGAAEAAAATEPPTQEATDDSPPQDRRRTALVVLGVAVLLVVGFAAGRFQPAPPPPIAAAPSGDALSVFNRAQGPVDAPSIDLGFDIRAETTRSLGQFGDPIQNIYGSRTDSGLLCLSVLLATGASATTCSTVAQFRRDGLRLRITTTDVVQNTDPEGVTAPAFYQYYWSNDGALSGSSNTSLFSLSSLRFATAGFWHIPAHTTP